VLVPTVQYSTVKYSTVTKCILEFNSLHERIIEAVVGGGAMQCNY
jgi:hypothetical protein